MAEDDRIRELARMLAGSDTDTARDHAAELLREAAAGRAADVGPAGPHPASRAPARPQAAAEGAREQGRHPLELITIRPAWHISNSRYRWQHRQA